MADKPLHNDSDSVKQEIWNLTVLAESGRTWILILSPSDETNKKDKIDITTRVFGGNIALSLGPFLPEKAQELMSKISSQHNILEPYIFASWPAVQKIILELETQEKEYLTRQSLPKGGE